MEREIKFKAWSKATEKMTEWEFIKSVRNFEKLLTLDHVVVLQFTGLKDKNGKEIYEGDIVKYYQPYAKRYDTHIVKWDSLFACFSLFEEGNEWAKESDWVKITALENLGNVFETPELIPRAVGV